MKKKIIKNVVAPTQTEINAVVDLYNKRDYDKAELSARDLIQRYPKSGFGWKVLGSVLQSKGDINASIEAKQKAADLSPNDAEALSNLGNALQENGRFDEAEKCLLKAVKIAPKLAVAHNNLSIVYQKLNYLDNAEKHHKHALQLQSNYAEAHYNYGVTLQRLERFDEAEKCYRKGIELQPNYAKAHSNLGVLLKNQSRFAEAEQHFLTAFQFEQNYIDAHYNYSLLLMLLGRIKEGFAEYQWFYHPQNTNPSKPNYPNLKAKQWQGEPLQGKIILIHSEQGFGDMIQFARYAENLKALGATVWILVADPLIEIFKTLPWAERILQNGEQHILQFDYWVFPLALPFWFQSTLETMPMNLPYLSIDSAKSAWWQNWLNQEIPKSHKRIGLVWAGNPVHANDANRSIQLSEFSIFAELENVTFISLQLGEKARADIAANPQLNIIDASEKIHDFTDSAALLNNLDVLITVDSAPAHLAGALNLPVWVLITHVPDWRWLLNRDDSIWYQSVRLFRQPQRGDWQGVLQQVKSELITLKKTENAFVDTTTLNSNHPVNQLLALYEKQDFVNLEIKAKELLAQVPDNGFLWKVLGAALSGQEKIEESIFAKQKAVEYAPEDPETHSNLGIALSEKNVLNEAKACFEKAIAINPNFAVGHFNLGNTFRKLNLLENAEISFQNAIRLNPHYTVAHYNYGAVLHRLNRLDEAELLYQKALVSEPDYANVHFNLALLFLLRGDFLRGWEEYQWRYHPKFISANKSSFPENLSGKPWQGESLENKTILIHSEQGFGDMIQLVRYAENLKALGAIVWVLVKQPLVDLFKSITWVEKAFTDGDKIPKNQLDFWVFPFMLPFLCKTQLPTIPNTVPYLFADKAKAEWWKIWLEKQIPKKNKRIGLVWAGKPSYKDDEKRSLTLEQFSIFADLQNVTFVSLQLGEKVNEIKNSQLNILDASPFIQDFNDSAALLENLDLLITVDSAPAHLAGALNLPVWVLITHVPDWRWLLNREDSVWYQSVRLFRQSQRDDWQDVLKRMNNSLKITYSL